MEMAAVGKAGLAQYRSALSIFMTWCAAMNLDWSSPETLHELLVFWADRMYFMGKKVNTGSLLLAALQHFSPATDCPPPGQLSRFWYIYH